MTSLASAAPASPQGLTMRTDSARNKGTRNRSSLAFRSGRPSPCTAVKGTYARALKNTPAARI